MITGVEYRKIDDAGLHIVVDAKEIIVPADSVIVCAGQEPRRWPNQGFHHIGGAREAGELDAERAMREGAELAAALLALRSSAGPGKGPGARSAGGFSRVGSAVWAFPGTAGDR